MKSVITLQMEAGPLGGEFNSLGTYSAAIKSVSPRNGAESWKARDLGHASLGTGGCHCRVASATCNETSFHL